MKLLQILCFAFITLNSGLMGAAPKWNAERVKEVRFRDGVPGREVDDVRIAEEIKEILGCFQRAVEVAGSEARRDWPKCIDLVGERPESGRWLYDPVAGEFSRLDPMVQRVYRFSESDRIRINIHFEKKPANKSAQTTAMTRPAPAIRLAPLSGL